MQDDGAVSRARHAGVGNAHHVFDAGRQQLLGDRQEARLRHAGFRAWTGVCQNEKIVGRHIQIGRVDASGHVGQIVEHHRAASLLEQRRRCRRAFDDRPVGRERTEQRHQTTLRFDGFGSRLDDAAVDVGAFLVGEAFAQRFARDGHAVEVEKRLQFAHHGADAASGVEILHVEFVADGFDGGEHGRRIGQLVEPVQVELDADAAGDGGEVNDAIGRPAQRQQHTRGILDRFLGNDLSRQDVASDEGDCRRARGFCGAQAIGMDGGNGSRARQRHAQRFGNGSHSRCRAHDGATSRRRHQATLDLLDIGLPHAARPVLHPEPAAVGAGADAVILVAARHLRATDELDRGFAGAGRPHELGWHRLVAGAQQHDRIHRLGTDHLFSVHGHEVAELHGVGRQRRLVQRNRRELEGQTASRRDAALHGFHELGEVTVARVEFAERVGDADHRPFQFVGGIAHRLGEGTPHVDGEIAISVVLQAAQKAALTVAAGCLRCVDCLRFLRHCHSPFGRAASGHSMLPPL